MDYTKIVSRAWDIVKTNRYLWWLGILAGFGGSSAGMRWYNFGGSHSRTTPPNSPGLDQSMRAFQDMVAANAPILVWVGILLVIFIFCALYISYAAQAGLILSADAIEHKKKSHTFREAYRSGRPFAWRLFGMHVLLNLAMLGVFFILVSLAFILLLVAAGPGNLSGLDVAFGLLGIILFVIVVVVMVFLVSLVLELGKRALVLNDSTITDAIIKAKELLYYEFTSAFFASLVNSIVVMLAAIMFMIALLVSVGLLVAIGLMFFAFSTMLGLAYCLVASLAVVAALFTIGGLLCAYQSVYWTLSYEAIAYLAHHKKKSKE